MTPGATAPVLVTVNLTVLGTTAGWMSSTLQASQEVTLNVIYQATITPSLAGGLGAANAMSAGQEALQLVIDRAKANNFGLQAWNVVAPAMNLATWIGAGNLGPSLVNLLSLDDPSGAVAATFYRQGMVSTSSDPLVQWVDSALYNNGQPLTAGSAPLYGTYWNPQATGAVQVFLGVTALMNPLTYLSPSSVGAALDNIGAGLATANGSSSMAGVSAQQALSTSAPFITAGISLWQTVVNAAAAGLQPLRGGVPGLGRAGLGGASWEGALGLGEQRLADLRQGAFASGGMAMSESAVGLVAAEQGCLAAACFSGRMLIDVAGGKKRANVIRVGDLVASRSEFNPDGPVQYKEVQEVFVYAAEIVNLHVGGEIIETTARHPFYAVGRGWVEAGALEIDDLLITRDGQLLVVQGVAPSGTVAAVYNWRVQDYHTYFVGSEESRFSVWAHNACSSTRGNNAASAVGRAKHKEFSDKMVAAGNLGETTLSNGKRADGLKFNKNGLGGIVYELKPKNARAIARGLKQVGGYVAQLTSQFGGIWRGIVITY